MLMVQLKQVDCWLVGKLPINKCILHGRNSSKQMNKKKVDVVGWMCVVSCVWIGSKNFRDFAYEWCQRDRETERQTDRQPDSDDWRVKGGKVICSTITYIRNEILLLQRWWIDVILITLLFYFLIICGSMDRGRKFYYIAMLTGSLNIAFFFQQIRGVFVYRELFMTNI